MQNNNKTQNNGIEKSRSPRTDSLAGRIDPSVLEHDAYATMTNHAIKIEGELTEHKKVIEALLEWIDAVPKDTILPGMPGVDRDWVENVLYSGK